MSVGLRLGLVFVRLVRFSILCFLFLWPPYVIGKAIIFMVTLCNRADHYIKSCGFFFILPYLLARLISAVEHWMSTILPHVVWP